MLRSTLGERNKKTYKWVSYRLPKLTMTFDYWQQFLFFFGGWRLCIQILEVNKFQLKLFALWAMNTRTSHRLVTEWPRNQLLTSYRLLLYRQSLFPRFIINLAWTEVVSAQPISSEEYTLFAWPQYLLSSLFVLINLFSCFGKNVLISLLNLYIAWKGVKKASHQTSYRIYSINRPRRLLNFWTLRVGACSRWALIKFSPFSGSVACLFWNNTINGINKTRRCNKARFL